MHPILYVALGAVIYLLTRHLVEEPDRELPESAARKAAKADVKAFISLVDAGITVTKVAIQKYYKIAQDYQFPERIYLQKVLIIMGSSTSYQLVR